MSDTPGTRLTRALPLLLTSALLLAACSDGGSGGGSLTEIDALPAKRNLLPDLPLADAEFESVHFSGNGQCVSCHTDQEALLENKTMVVQEDAGLRDLSIGSAWEASMMANSTRDPYWHAVVASELERYKAADGVEPGTVNAEDALGTVCVRCHAPMASIYAEREGQDFRLFDSGSEGDADYVKGFYSMTKDDPLYNHAMDGISCSFCHQVADDGNMGTPAGMSGGFYVDATNATEELKADRPAYGPFADPEAGYMRQQAAFTPMQGLHLSTSESCAACHNLNTHPFNETGNVYDIDYYPEQAAFTEWQASVFGTGGAEEANCQSCHMPKVDAAVPLAGGGSAPKRNGFSEHTFLGPNTVMQKLLEIYREELAVPEQVDFASSIARNREFLKTAATVELGNTGLANDTLSFDVTVTNQIGHKLPTGYHSRRVYLHVLVTDASGSVVYENGRIDQTTGAIAGIDEDSNPHLYEPHHDVITEATQVQVYQAVPSDIDGHRTHSLLNATGYLKDNRLTPRGFTKAGVSADIAVHGEAAADNDFDQGRDVVTYQVALGDEAGTAPYNVLVELRYQPISYGHLRDLFTESERIDAVDMFRTMYDEVPFKDEVIATAVGNVQ